MKKSKGIGKIPPHKQEHQRGNEMIQIIYHTSE